MGPKIVQETIALELPVFQALDPIPEALPLSYPYPELAYLETWQTREFEALVLSNELVRLVVCPALGGRIVSILDLRTQRELLGGTFAAVAGGERAWLLAGGLGFYVGAYPGLRESGPVDIRQEEADEVATIVLGDLIAGRELSWHASISLREGSAAVKIGLRAINRSLHANRMSCGLALSLLNGRFVGGAEGLAAYSQAGDFGLAMCAEPGTFLEGDSAGGVMLAKLAADLQLAPRDSFEWEGSLVPFGGIGRPLAWSRDAVLGLEGQVLRLQATRELEAQRLLVQLSDGGTLEARTNLHPARAFEIDAAAFSGPVSAFAQRDGSGERLRWTPGDRVDDFVPPPPATFPHDWWERTLRMGEAGRRQLAAALVYPHLRGPAWLALGSLDAKAGKHAEAARRYEEALTYNGPDHISWVLKAICERLAGDPERHDADLQNAHFLAPLEPLLLAEALLGVPSDAPIDALARKVGEDPDGFIESVHVLWQAGLEGEAERLLELAAESGAGTMGAYLLAWTRLRAGRPVDAAVLVDRQEAAEGFSGPNPSRELEARALEQLADRFTDRPRLEFARRAAIAFIGRQATGQLS